jgi:F0F1-type ATP synthase assembly protein I
MPTTQDESTRRIEWGSGLGLVTGAGLGIIFDLFLGRSGLGLIFGAGLGLVFRSEAGTGTSEGTPAQIQS